MNETKLKQRIENAVDAFFDDNFTEEFSISTANEKSLSQKFHSPEFSEKVDKFYRLFKKAFLFLPGVLILHFASISSALFFSYEGTDVSRCLFWIAAGSFMVWAGIGDLSNKKHSLIPVPMIVLGLVAGAALSYLPPTAFNYILLLLPLFFIAPVLTKDAIDLLSENETRLTNPETML